MTENRYTDKQYWENYYHSSNINISRIKNIVGLRGVTNVRGGTKSSLLRSSFAIPLANTSMRLREP